MIRLFDLDKFISDHEAKNDSIYGFFANGETGAGLINLDSCQSYWVYVDEKEVTTNE